MPGAPIYRPSDTYPLSEKEAILVTNSGAALIDLEQRALFWAITCPARGCSALNLTASLLALSRGKHVFLWDLQLGKLAQTFELAPEARGITDLALSTDGSLLAVAPFGLGIQLWRVADGILF